MEMSSYFSSLSNLQFVLTACFSAFILLYLYVKYIVLHREGKILPGPFGYPFIGTLLEFSPSKTNVTVDKYIKKFGLMFETWVLTKRLIVISDVEIMKEIFMKRPKYFRRPRNFEIANSAINIKGSLISSNGAVWSRIRRLMMPSFSHQNVTGMTESVVDESLRFAERLCAVADGKKEVNVALEAQCLALRVISRVALGGEDDNNSTANKYFYSTQFAEDMQHFFKFFLERILFKLPNFMWKMSSAYKYEIKAVEADKRLTECCMDVMRQTRERNSSTAGISSSLKKSNTILDVLLRKESDDVGISGITDEEILGNVKVIYMAGSETTSVTLTWTLFFLSLHHKILEDVRTEAAPFMKLLNHTINISSSDISVAEGSDNLKQIDSSTLHAATSKLYLCQAAFKEALRLCSPLINAIHETESDTEKFTLSNGLNIYPGDMVFLNINGVLRNPLIFENPAQFNPYRWLSVDQHPKGMTDLKALAAAEEAFVAFGYGPRICLGLGIANMEGMLALAAVCHHLDFKLTHPANEVKRILNFTTQPNKIAMCFSIRGKDPSFMTPTEYDQGLPTPDVPLA